MLYAVWLEGFVLLFGQTMLNAKARLKNEGVSEGDLVCCCGLARQDCFLWLLVFHSRKVVRNIVQGKAGLFLEDVKLVVVSC